MAVASLNSEDNAATDKLSARPRISPPKTEAKGLPRPPRIAAENPFTAMLGPTLYAVCVNGVTATPAIAPRAPARQNVTITTILVSIPINLGPHDPPQTRAWPAQILSCCTE